jgi:hypothetical protein
LWAECGGELVWHAVDNERGSGSETMNHSREVPGTPAGAAAW